MRRRNVDRHQCGSVEHECHGAVEGIIVLPATMMKRDRFGLSDVFPRSVFGLIGSPVSIHGYMDT